MTEQEKIDIIFEVLDDFTSGGKLYYDDETESIWMINPETKKWIFEFEKSGTLWYSYWVFTDIFKWLSMEWPDFNPYITKWVERILQNEVKYTKRSRAEQLSPVERILQNEVKYTSESLLPSSVAVERILQNEVKYSVERILQNEVKYTSGLFLKTIEGVERILQNEVKYTPVPFPGETQDVERILQTGNKLTRKKNNKMKDIKENFDWRAILSNIVGDKVRATLGKIPGLNVPVGIASIVLNFDELNEDMEQYYKLKKEFESKIESGNSQEGSDNLLERFKQIEEELKVDFIDMLQSAGEMAIPGFKVFNIIGMPLLTSLSIESILDEVSNVLPFDEKAEDSMVPYLAAIKDIGNMKKQLEPYENPEDILDKLVPPITEGRKKTGTKLCARGKAAAKAKFEVYPSAYSNGYGVQVCKGKIKGLDGKRRCSPPYC